MRDIFYPLPIPTDGTEEEEKDSRHGNYVQRKWSD